MTTIRYITSGLLVALFTAGLFAVGQSVAEGDLGDGVRLKTGCVQSILNYDSLTDQQIREVFPD